MGLLEGKVAPMWNVKSLVLVGAACAALAVTLSACAGFGSSPTGTDGTTPNGGDASVNTEDILGTWSIDAKGTPTLEFAEDGAVSGTDGCNGISTTYTVEGDRVVLEQFASTMMACQGVDDWLRGVREVTVDGDTLIVKNASGTEIGQLERQSS